MKQRAWQPQDLSDGIKSEEWMQGTPLLAMDTQNGTTNSPQATNLTKQGRDTMVYILM